MASRTCCLVQCDALAALSLPQVAWENQAELACVHVVSEGLLGSEEHRVPVAGQVPILASANAINPSI